MYVLVQNSEHEDADKLHYAPVTYNEPAQLEFITSTIGISFYTQYI